MIVDNFTGGMVLWIRGSSHGYPEVYLHDVNGKHYNLLAHRIVAHTYIGDVTGKIVHHSDENKENPAVDNLIIEDTQTDHLQHHVVGDSNPTAVLTNEEVHSICKLLEDRVPFPKIIEQVHNPNLTPDIISKISVGKNWYNISSQYNIPRVKRSIMNEFSSMAEEIGKTIVENNLTILEAADYFGIERGTKRYDRFHKCAKRYVEKYKNNHGLDV
jgi:hypothetical protein